jgi:glycosyltransferase involved in cell wall biosynthesis
VTDRIAISSIARNLFSNRKTIIILYNYDEDDHKSYYLNFYYKLLFSILKINLDRVCIICQSPYFQEYFSKKFQRIPIYRVSNLFSTEKYSKLQRGKDPKKILLGQFSYKNDHSVFELARKLAGSGYYCYFLTMDERAIGKFADYEVKSVLFDEYLYEMATSYCSIAFSRVKEGWNRMVHESILVGTPVIGYASGGLGDLLQESGSYIVQSADEAYDLIDHKKVILRTPGEFIEKYDESQWSTFLEPVIKFIRS